MEPVWRLIKGCEWDLQAIINGLETMDFSSNVRDNSLLKVHTDLSVRKYFNREHCVVPPSHIGLLDPLMAEPNIWDSRQLARLITHQQFTSLRSEQKSSLGHHGSNFKTPDLGEITLTLLNPVENCIGHMHKNRLHIFRGKQPFISLIPRFIWPKPRLTP
ncbi:MAG: hypothetical protein CSA60_00870 [Neptuniibacter caesariensis]|uniref:Uncharacterized protein n=1 Tax=Neptuniibacter caesariensis TaxID=207954 RepID=A0A2G6JRZ3_NEPCE|nr:MAG: hypothetical protein CSA60_00870 [Neptuniibacter caesariensis]